MHQRQRQGCVGARAQRDVFVALVGGFAAARVDADQARTVALGLLRQTPEVQVAADGVAAPDQDQLRFGEELHLHAELAAQGLHQCFTARRSADGALQVRGAEPVEEARGHALALHLAHGAGIAVGQDGLRVARRDGVQPAGDVIQRLVPADGFEPAAAFGADPLERGEDAVRVVAALGVARDLGAQRPVGGAVVGIALHPHGHAVLDRGQQGTGVGAVMRTGAAHGVGGLGIAGVHRRMATKGRRIGGDGQSVAVVWCPFVWPSTVQAGINKTG